MENWKSIIGYEGLYEVSDQGRVKSLKRGKERILKPAKQRWGYLQVRLCKNSQKKDFKVHRLVAEAFCPNPCPDKFDQVNHRDENKTNNAASNLEWCDAKYNKTYSEGISVQQFNKQGNLLATYPSVREAERVTRIGHSHIIACCKGKFKSSGGFIWKFK